MADTSTLDIPVQGEVSSNEAELNAKIDQELGITPVKAEEVKTDEPTGSEPDAPSPDPADEDKTAEPGDEEPAKETPEEPAPEEEVAEPEEPGKTEPQAPPTQPSDAELFIEVLDAEGVTHKISSIDDLPEDFAPKNNRQILEIIRDTEKLDAQRQENAAKAEVAEQEAFMEQTKQEQFTAWDSEVAELAKTKRIDAGDSERINAVFGHMNEVNAARQKAGNPNFVTSFEDALEKFEAKEALDKAEASKKNDNERAKLKSGLIGRSSASSGADNYVYRAGSARNMDDIPV